MAKDIRHSLLPDPSNLRHPLRLRLPTSRCHLRSTQHHRHLDRRHVHLHPRRNGHQNRRIRKGLPATPIQYLPPTLQLRCGFRHRLRILSIIGSRQRAAAEPGRRHDHLRIAPHHGQHGAGSHQVCGRRRGRSDIQCCLRKLDGSLRESSVDIGVPRRERPGRSGQGVFQIGVTGCASHCDWAVFAEVRGAREGVCEEVQAIL
mmetsp:Transcript_14007/g.25336  ORF Transcript_14007/g.25336 Transcript_14007/m.25336 type:complete len:203 (+) Transcript_14007:133-741(+)